MLAIDAQAWLFLLGVLCLILSFSLPSQRPVWLGLAVVPLILATRGR